MLYFWSKSQSQELISMIYLSDLCLVMNVKLQDSFQIIILQQFFQIKNRKGY